MSEFLDKAEAVKTRLEGVPELADLDIIVDRQKDLSSDFKKSISKRKGAAIIIFWEGCDIPNPDEDVPELMCNYLITVWSKPILRKGRVPADELVKATFLNLYAWSESGICPHKMRVQNIRLAPHPLYLVYELRIKAPTILA